LIERDKRVGVDAATARPPIPRRRVLWLSHLLPWPPKGGLMQRSYYLMREVARHHDLHVVALRQRAHQPDAARLEEARAAIAEFATLSHVSDLPEEDLAGGRARLALESLLPGRPFTVRWALSATYGAAVRAAVEEFEPDVVHFDTISLAPYLDEIRDQPAVLNHHNIESAMLLRRAALERHPLKRAYFWQEGLRLARYERSVARRFRRHLVCAELDAERLVATVGPVASTVVPNGVDLDFFRPAPPGTLPDPGSMIFVGGLGWYPNLSAMRFFVNEVWPLLTRRRPEVEFRLVGQGPPPDLQAAATRDPRIRVMGFVDDVHPLFDRSMVYVCPIFDGGGTKLKMLDAMAMGKAIVAHPVACEGLNVTDGEQVLHAVEPEEFVDQILRVMDDPELREGLERSGRDHVVRGFSFKSIGERLSQLYVDVVDAGLKSRG